LGQEYGYQKLLKSDMLLQITIINVGDPFFETVYIVTMSYKMQWPLPP